MKRISYLIAALCLIFFLFVPQLVNAGAFKLIRVGRLWSKAVDSGDQGELAGECSFDYYDFDGFLRNCTQSEGAFLGTTNWKDENGNIHPIKICAASILACDENIEIMPIPDSKGITVHKYMRNQPPTITVDGFRLDEPFPMTGDEVNPDKILETATLMVESQVRTSMGISILIRVLAWDQMYHDDYIIRDWTFTNTGNVDFDDDIELPDQTINDFYYMRIGRYGCGGINGNWLSRYGEREGDSLRIGYMYTHRVKGHTYDSFGMKNNRYGHLNQPYYFGQVMLHADKSSTDHSDDPSQPQMTSTSDPNIAWVRQDGFNNTPEGLALIYRTMEEGYGHWNGQIYMENTYPGTHHTERMDEQGAKDYKDLAWQNSSDPMQSWSCGPYTLAPGQSIRLVWATVVGSISPEVAWREFAAWQNGTCKWDAWDNEPNDLATYYPAFGLYPDLAPTYNDQAKDRWVCSGKDSLFTNAWAAQWAVRNDYNVPIPPPAPSIEVNSRPDKIEISWGNESESASDFAGYRVYRAVGDNYYSETGGVVVGKWERIFECGKGTNSYEDKDAERGVAYFYYVTAFDDGIQNIPDFNGKRESLESGQYLNMTTHAAYLTRAAGTLSTVRVVPNPFNIGAAELQYVGEENKIMFLDIPGYCTIKIYSESGDLVKTLYHTDGSGDESWGDLWEEHSTTETGQLIVSGIYIALIEENNADGTATGNTHFVKFVVVR